MMFVPRRKHTYVASRPVTWDRLTFLYADDVRTLQERHLRPSTACYGDSFIPLFTSVNMKDEYTHLGCDPV
jgi:hypothetical protein